MTGLIKWGQKSKPQKIPRPNFTPPKIPPEFLSIKNFQKALNDNMLHFIHKTTWLGNAGTTTNLQIVLNTQKNPPYLNQVPPK